MVLRRLSNGHDHGHIFVTGQIYQKSWPWLVMMTGHFESRNDRKMTSHVKMNGNHQCPLPSCPLWRLRPFTFPKLNRVSDGFQGVPQWHKLTNLWNVLPWFHACFVLKVAFQKGEEEEINLTGHDCGHTFVTGHAVTFFSNRMTGHDMNVTIRNPGFKISWFQMVTNKAD